jgi:hypothetical protein
MMKKVNKYLRLLPPLIWMALIFWASSQPKVGMGGNYWVSFAIFKTIHVIEYGILYSLLRLGFGKAKLANLVAIVIATLYGMSDEFHQTLVPTREGTIRDVIIDFFGIIIFSQFIFDFAVERLKKIKLFRQIYPQV